jgi:hypothetical protein
MASYQFLFPFGCLWISLLTHFSYLLPFSCLLFFVAELIYFILDIATLQLSCNSCWTSFYLLLFLETLDNFQKVSVVILLFTLPLFLQASNLKALYLFKVSKSFFYFFSSFLITFSFFFNPIFSFLQNKLFHVLLLYRWVFWNQFHILYLRFLRFIFLSLLFFYFQFQF